MNLFRTVICPKVQQMNVFFNNLKMIFKKLSLNYADGLEKLKYP